MQWNTEGSVWISSQHCGERQSFGGYLQLLRRVPSCDQGASCRICKDQSKCARKFGEQLFRKQRVAKEMAVGQRENIFFCVQTAFWSLHGWCKIQSNLLCARSEDVNVSEIWCSPSRLACGLSVMLVKELGYTLINKLMAIPLMEADFNFFPTRFCMG